MTRADWDATQTSMAATIPRPEPAPARPVVTCSFEEPGYVGSDPIIVARAAAPVEQSATRTAPAPSWAAARTVLGSCNVSRALGTGVGPAAVALAGPWIGWRGAVGTSAAVGLAAAVVMLLVPCRLRAGVETVARGETSGSSTDWGMR